MEYALIVVCVVGVIAMWSRLVRVARPKLFGGKDILNFLVGTLVLRIEPIMSSDESKSRSPGDVPLMKSLHPIGKPPVKRKEWDETEEGSGESGALINHLRKRRKTMRIGKSIVVNVLEETTTREARMGRSISSEVHGLDMSQMEFATHESMGVSRNDIIRKKLGRLIGRLNSLATLISTAIKGGSRPRDDKELDSSVRPASRCMSMKYHTIASRKRIAINWRLTLIFGLSQAKGKRKKKMKVTLSAIKSRLSAPPSLAKYIASSSMRATMSRAQDEEVSFSSKDVEDSPGSDLRVVESKTDDKEETPSRPSETRSSEEVALRPSPSPILSGISKDLTSFFHMRVPCSSLNFL
ncbi:hypothetical protein ACFE04_028694 [Oxalis oulophora]